MSRNFQQAVSYAPTPRRAPPAFPRLVRGLVAGALCLAPLGAMAAASAWCGKASDATCELAQKIGVGINVDSPLTNDQNNPQSRLSAASVADLCQRFKAIRLPFRFADDNGTPLPKNIAASKALADQFVACGMVVIVDNHIFKGFEKPAGAGDKSAENAFNAVWTQVAQAYKGDSQNIVLELLNEPSDKVDPQRWNAAVAAVVPVIRAAGAQNTLLVGPTQYNGVWGLRNLQLPAEKSLIVGVHIYEPMRFTHQGAQWLRSPLPAGVACCDSTQQTDFAQLITRARSWSTSAGVPVVVGEFGVLRAAPPQARRDYVRTFVRAATQAQLPLLYWEYDKSFGLYDPKAQTWDQDMLDALAGKDQAEATRAAPSLAGGPATAPSN